VSDFTDQQLAESYSRAFENLVRPSGDEEDVVGLVAYALFKKSIREDSRAGIATTGDKRNPSETTVKTYRAAAEQLLTEVVGRAIDEATPEIQQSTVLAAVEAAESKLEAHITKRTDFFTALIANVSAWGITLAIAAMILFLAARPNIEQAIVDATRPKVEQPPAKMQLEKR
jgi:hypothetical protein